MKVYSKIVIDIESLAVVSEISEDYTGPVAQCKSGGGGNAVTTYPAYIQAEHQRWLQGNAGFIYPGGLSVSQFQAIALANPTPYAGHIPAPTDTAFLGIGKSVADFTGPFDRIKTFAAYDIDTQYNAYLAITDPVLGDVVDVHSLILDDEYSNKILPPFEAGMADVNAVMSSAFVIGRGLLLDTKQKQISKFTKDLQLQAFDWATKRVSLNMDMHKLLITSSTELSRMYIAAKLETDRETFEMNDKDARWHLDVFQYGTQVMAAIGGTATSSTETPHQSKIAGALSGALSGASAGSAVPGVGTAVGGIAGAIGGLL